MKNETKRVRILQAINETRKELIVAEKRLERALWSIQKDTDEGYRVTETWIAFRDSDQARVDELNAHIEKLNGMLKAVA